VRPIDLALRYEDETRLVKWRDVRYGTLAPTFKSQEAGVDMSVLTMQDRDMLARYMTLSLAERKTVCDVVAALAVAATVKVSKG
jgi:hypothetical protein